MYHYHNIFYDGKHAMKHNNKINIRFEYNCERYEKIIGPNLGLLIKETKAKK